MNYQIIRLTDKPELKEQMAHWFNEKWSVPLTAYLESMEECLTGKSPGKLYSKSGHIEELMIK